MALGANDPAVSVHVGECAACRAHLDRCAGAPPFPRWAAQLSRPRWRWRLRWPLLTLLAGAAAGLLLIAAPGRRERIVAKGSPSVAVYVLRDGQVSLWDGARPLRAGDAVQLRVQPGEFSQVTVASVEHGELQELYRGEIRAGDATLLPAAFALDGQARDEKLLVVFSNAPLAPDRLRGAFQALTRDRQLWSTLLDLTQNGANR